MKTFEIPASAIEISTGAEYTTTISVEAKDQNDAMAKARAKLMDVYPASKFKKQKIGK